MASKKTTKATGRTLDARPDTLDFRDRLYVPALIEVPTQVPLADWLAHEVPVLDQGTEGACTGFGLATVANYLLLRRRVVPDKVPVSARMFYELARRYDEWPGEDYSGSSARGAMKGWHKHGVCSDAEWPYKERRAAPRGLTDRRSADARLRPLGAYFRVNHKDLIAMHAAIAEVGVLYATAMVHDGWDRVRADGTIPQAAKITGGHAFAIVAYDARGLWIQNSWGTGWGRRGFARIGYDDWLENGSDVWVARLGAPVTLRKAASAAEAHASRSAQSVAYAYADLRPHVVSVGNDGRLEPGGDYGTTERELAQVFESDIPRAIGEWPRQRLLLYAHGGLVSERAAVQRLAEYRPPLLAARVWPLAFVWRTDTWTTIANVLQDAVRRRRPEGVLDAAQDFMLDRLDDLLEPLARQLTGKAAWNEMKENALAASRAGGAARRVLEHVVRLKERFKDLEIHFVAHSAGSILLAPLVKLLAEHGIAARTCALWAPACTVDLFKESYLRAIEAGTIERFAVFALADAAERDDHCAHIYNKSLLYLVSNAFEHTARIPLARDGVPLLGMEKFVRADRTLARLFESGRADLIVAPNNEPAGSDRASQARRHNDFDDDERTVAATFARIAAPAGPAPATPIPGLAFRRSNAALRERRLDIDARTQLSN